MSRAARTKSTAGKTSSSRGAKATGKRGAGRTRTAGTSASKGAARRGGARDAVAVLKEDHRKVEDLFQRFEKASPRAQKQKRQIVDKIVRELSVHAVIEEEIFYPRLRETLQQQGMVLEALEEHHLVKVQLAELDRMSPDEERFDAKVHVLMENVRHHVKEEERDMLPKIRKAVDSRELRELGKALEQAKKIAPTRPHPHAPDEPPAGVVAGVAAAVVDRARDAVGRVTGGGDHDSEADAPGA